VARPALGAADAANLSPEEVDYRLDRCMRPDLLERKTIQYEGFRLEAEGYDALALRTFAERSRAYLDAVGIATEFVERTLARVTAAGGAGSMALFGDTVFAVDVDGVLANRTAVSNAGARVEP